MCYCQPWITCAMVPGVYSAVLSQEKIYSTNRSSLKSMLLASLLLMYTWVYRCAKFFVMTGVWFFPPVLCHLQCLWLLLLTHTCTLSSFRAVKYKYMVVLLLSSPDTDVDAVPDLCTSNICSCNTCCQLTCTAIHLALAVWFHYLIATLDWLLLFYSPHQAWSSDVQHQTTFHLTQQDMYC